MAKRTLYVIQVFDDNDNIVESLTTSSKVEKDEFIDRMYQKGFKKINVVTTELGVY